jgi:tRNA uridine 5-carbamoylmethylation protein Kti12
VEDNLIIFINGPFGVGKTTTARLVAKRLGRAVIFDPEFIGMLLHRFLRDISGVEDFQNYKLWAPLTAYTARLLSRITKKPVIVPMTVSNKARWKYLTKAVKSDDRTVVCVRLTCSEEVLRQRILDRPHEGGPHEWCLNHVADGVRMMSDPDFGEAVDTENNKPEAVAEIVCSLLPGSSPVGARA